MSFFKEFKEDLSQAVNELMPGEEQDSLGKEDILVNTFDDEIDLESELSKLDGLLEKVSHETEEGKEQKESLFHEEKVNTNNLFFQNDKTENLFVEKEQKEEKEPTQEKKVDEKVNTTSEKNSTLKAQEESVKEDKKDGVKDEGKKEINDNSNEKSNLNFKNDKNKNALDSTTADTQKSFHKKDDVKSFNNHKFEEKEHTIEEEVQMNGTGDVKDILANDKSTLDVVKEEVVDTTAHLQATDETAVITTGTTLKGNISSNGSIDLQGEIEGDIQCNGKLVVTGTIKGNSNSAEFFADSAKIEGEVVSTGTVKIGLGSVVIGNVKATSAVIAGAIKGDIDVKGPVVVDTSAVVMGNIKSRSVQINNGAVIEGFCSQSYAEINMESLFGENGEKKGKK